MNETKAPVVTGANDLSTQEVYTGIEGTTSEAPLDPSSEINRATLPDGNRDSDSDNNQPAKAASMGTEESETLRDIILKMAIDAGCEPFRDSSRNTYACIPNSGHRENWRLRSDGLKRWLRYQWLKTTKRGLGTSVIADVIDTMDAMAAFGEQEADVHLRVAHHEGNIYVDLCDDEWRVVRITAAGWEIINDPPVRFIRTKGMLPLPLPKTGGNINDLRPFINAPTNEIWCLLVAWILSAFSKGPFPVLVLTGEQGSSKSFLCRVLRQLIDPSEVQMTTAPKEVRDLIMAATNSYVVALDNLSRILAWLSDLLCSTSTGAAYRERKYHTNSGEEELFKAKRPIVLNGIDFAMRDDLLSRSFLIMLPVIADADRQDESALWASINQAMPGVLGAIFDVLCAILRNLPTTKLSTKPRMADVALWVTAAEPALGWESGHFMRVYAGNRNQSAEMALESDSFGLALRDHMLETSNGRWGVSWKHLLSTLSAGQAPAEWPTNSKALAIRLTRLAPALRHVGIRWTHVRGGDGKRFYLFEADVANPADVTKAHQQGDPADSDPSANDPGRGQMCQGPAK